jgi:nucleoporin GLE1
LHISALWADHPDFGQLFLAHTYDTCRYLIPYIPSVLPANPSRQDYEDRGYKYEDDGTVEKQDRFVNRMGGVARLLACIAVSPLPTGEQGKEHPFGLGNIWRWISSTLNLTPVNDVTATILYDVLEITASHLMEKYNKHFFELIRLLNDEYITRIREVTIAGSGGPIERLQEFLKKIINNPNSIKAPSSSKLKSGMNFL